MKKKFGRRPDRPDRPQHGKPKQPFNKDQYFDKKRHHDKLRHERLRGAAPRGAEPAEGEERAPNAETRWMGGFEAVANLSEETKRNIAQSEREIKAGKTIPLSQIKKEFGLK